MVDEEAFQRTFTHAMELWFEPEIRRRQESGAAPKPFPLHAAQVILYADTRPHQIRLNEEVQALGEMKLKDGVSKLKGEPVYLSEIEEIPSIRLPDSEDPNCGHFTLFLLGGRWYGSFDFRYNRGKAVEFLAAAEEFLATASHALSKGNNRAAVDNLFSAAELAAKAYVVTTPLPGDGDLRTHGRIHARFNMFARQGNVDADHRKTFNALSEARTRARYVTGSLAAASEDLAKWKADVEGLVQAVRSRIR
jgi:HEPN domain-containing protein